MAKRTDALTTFDRFETAFKNRSFKPLYYFCGDEHFLIDELVEVLIEHALEPHERDFNLSILYGSEVEGPAAMAQCGEYPTMAQRRVVVVREFEQMRGNEAFVSYAERPNPTSLVVLISSAKLSANPYRAISKLAETAKFDALKERHVGGWINRRTEQLGYEITGEATQVLSYLAGTDLRRLNNEILKLVTFAAEKKRITADDVLEVTGYSSEFNVFELQKAVGAHKYRPAIEILERMLQVSSNEVGTAAMTVSVLNGYFSKLYKLSARELRGRPPAELAKAIGVPPYYLKEYQAAQRRFSPEDLEAAHNILLATDYELKGGTERSEKLILALALMRLTQRKDRNKAQFIS